MNSGVGHVHAIRAAIIDRDGRAMLGSERRGCNTTRWIRKMLIVGLAFPRSHHLLGGDQVGGRRTSTAGEDGGFPLADGAGCRFVKWRPERRKFHRYTPLDIHWFGAR